MFLQIKFSVLKPLLVSLAFTMLTTAGCALEPIEVIVDTCGSDVKLQEGETLVVKLKSQRTAGYIWISEPLAGKTLTATGAPTIDRKKSDLDGGSEIQNFRFQALNQGSTTLGFRYQHPWATDKPPLQTCYITVTVKK